MRVTLVLARDAAQHHPVDPRLEQVETAEALDAETAYVLGGGGIYELFQPHADRMVLSRVPGEYEGDSTYPEWDREEWKLTDSTEYDRFTLEEWRRR